MLTKCENKVLTLMAAGLAAKEIAARTNNEVSTVQTFIANIKVKTGLQKAIELVSHFHCQRAGEDFEEFRQKILSSVPALLLFFAQCNRAARRSWSFNFSNEGGEI